MRKHAGVLSLFDREFIKTGRLGVQYSETIHDLYEARTDADYRDYIQIELEVASDLVGRAEQFVHAVTLELMGDKTTESSTEDHTGSEDHV